MKEEKNTRDKINILEEMASQALLVEMLNAKKAEVFENVVFEGKRRYYIEDLTQRDYTLENTTPYQFELDGHAIEERAWTIMICNVAKLLLELYPSFKETVTDFRCPWSKAEIFYCEKRTNAKEVYPGLYINCNHTALHSCWLIQDLLDYFGIDKSKVSLLIHRPCSAEPKKVKEYIEKRFKRGFIDFIMVHYKKTEEQAKKVITIIEKYLNPMLVKISRSYTNLFLFDDNATLSNYIKKIREQIDSSIRFESKAKVTLNKYLDWLVKYYKE